ncbi:hypothetical protein CC707_14930 [Salmonella enterica subsp. enterica serovar Panama]|uniref:Uncharacterized protein n=1 Tax=Salmonella enterica subsp. enterica serovar Panama TaxID=29472 RepID=A0A636GAD9_SALET|nr:hypothetical protein [Salmonella enterica subsp. enterica serovar Panama]
MTSDTLALTADADAASSDVFAAFWLTSAAAAEAAALVTEPAALISLVLAARAEADALFSDNAALLAAFSAASFIADMPREATSAASAASLDCCASNLNWFITSGVRYSAFVAVRKSFSVPSGESA